LVAESENSLEFVVMLGVYCFHPLSFPFFLFFLGGGVEMDAGWVAGGVWPTLLHPAV